jgi:hypothetical protein
LQKLEVSIYPNPANNYFDLRLDNNNDYKTLSIFTAQGVFVKEQVFRETEMRIKTGELISGVYVLEIKTSKGNLFKKIVVLH